VGGLGRVNVAIQGYLMSLDALTRMFAGCSSYKQTARATGSEALSRAEIAGLMAGLREIEKDYVYAVFGDEAAEDRVVNYVCWFVNQWASRSHWKDATAERLDKLAAVAVFEVVRPSVCRKCAGNAEVLRVVPGHPWDAKPCKACQGAGVIQLTQRQIAAAIGIDESNYRRAWKARYGQAYKMINGIATDAERVIRRQSSNFVLVA
jgi:hypothetical protein